MSINFTANGSQKIAGILSGTAYFDLVGAPAGVPEAEHGRFERQSDGEYRYIPKAGFFGIDNLTFGDGQTMTLLVGPPEGQGLKDVIDGINSIGTIVSDFGAYYEAENSNLHNTKLEEIDDREFNHFTLENNGKWSLMGEAVDLDGDGNAWEYEYYDFRIQQLTDIGIQVQDHLNSKINLHTVLWDQQGHQAQNIVNRFYSTNADASSPTVQEVFETSVADHLKVLLDALGNSVDLIDVVNEHIFSDHAANGHGVYNRIYDDPTGYIKFAFAETQRAIDDYNRDRPVDEQIDARLAINDFNVLYQFDDNRYDPAFDTPEVKADMYYDLVRGLIEDGVQIDVVGFQSHLSMYRINRHIGQNTDDDDPNNNVPATADEIYDAILGNLQRFIDLGVDIVISELDVRTHLNSYDPGGEVDHGASDFTMVYEVIGALVHDIPEITDVTLWGTAHHVSWLSDVENDPSLFSGNGVDGYSREAEYYAFMQGLTGNSDYNRVDFAGYCTSGSTPNGGASNVQAATYGTEGVDSLDGTDFTDKLYGFDGNDVFYGSSGSDEIYGQSSGGDEHDQVNDLGDGVSSSDFTFALNEENGAESVIATSDKYGQDTLYGIGGINFEEDGWKPIEDPYS